MIPTLFTVSYAGFWGQERLSLKDTLRKTAALGYEATEIMGKRPHLSIVDLSLDDVKGIKALTDELGLQVASVAGYTNFTAGQESHEVPIVEMQLAYLERLCQFAEVLGCGLVRSFTGYYVDQLSYFQQWGLCVQAVREACDIAAQYGVDIGLQNHHDIAVGVETYEEFLDEVDRPNLKAMYDAWSVAQFGTDLYASAKRLAPRMAQTTTADYTKSPRFRYATGLTTYEHLSEDIVRAVPMGEGFIDYDAFFEGLRDGGFDGFVCYEMCSPVRGGGSMENLDRCATIALSEIKRLIAG